MAQSLTPAAAFEIAHAHVAKWEGGYFDHPNDPGGVTNHGVSLMFLKSLGVLEGDIDGDGDIDRQDVLAITKDKAREIFKKHFWDKSGAEKLPPIVAIPFYDLAVNAGSGRSAIVLQQAINMLRPQAITAYAGNVGPLTQKHARAICDAGNARDLCQAAMLCRENWYRKLAAAKPSSAVFLKGWLNRVNDLRKTMSGVYERHGF